MIRVLVCAVLLAQAVADSEPAGPVEKYLRQCEAAKTDAVASVAREIESLEAIREPTNEQRQRLRAARERRKKLAGDAAPRLPLALPPAKDNVGVFAPIDERLGRSVDVLEVIDDDDVIVRAWYWSSSPLPKQPTADADATFVDLWIHGVDTSGLSARAPVSLSQVFQVTGNRLFDTTCGKRSLPLLEPVAIPKERNP